MLLAMTAPYLVEDVLHRAVRRRCAGGDADGDGTLRQPVLREQQLAPAGLVLDGIALLDEQSKSRHRHRSAAANINSGPMTIDT